MAGLWAPVSKMESAGRPVVYIYLDRLSERIARRGRVKTSDRPEPQDQRLTQAAAE